jgi:hypothetical protein
MKALTIFKKKVRKAVSTLSAVLIGMGSVGGLTFGYLTIQAGSTVLTTTSGVADVIGLLISIAVFVTGIYVETV